MTSASSTNPILAETTAELLKAESFDAPVTGKGFDVSDIELAAIKTSLKADFGMDMAYLSDDYIKSVASKPYSKDKSIRRPLAYTIEKLESLLKWRVESGATTLSELMDVATKTKAESGVSEERYDQAVKLANTMNNNSIYVHGYDKSGRPIIWLRTARKPWFLADVDAEVNLHIIMTDFAIASMPPGVTDFVVVCDSTTPPPPSPSFLVSTLKGLVRGYPDRLHRLNTAPLGTVLNTVLGLLVPLMPGALSSKLNLMREKSEMNVALVEILSDGPSDVPDFFGGSLSHDQFYPKEGFGVGQDFEALGEGVLMFDWTGMMQRQEEMKKEWMDSNGVGER